VPPPNVVLFISDQQRADTMPGVRRAREVRTPHLAWLAQRGTLFRSAFCVTPMCSPARARTGDDWPRVPVPDREVPKQPGGPWDQYR
jgi:arylsulfatase A-like enzyme